MPADAPPVPQHARESERLAQLAAAARPVQHDLNNLLTVIFANLDMLQRNATEEAPKRRLARVQEAARRFEATTRALLSLARRPIPGEVVMSPAAAVTALQPLLALILATPDALSVEAPAQLPACRFDQSLLDAALVGLAIDLAALPGGTLAVSLADEAERVALTLTMPAAAAEAGRLAAARLRLLAEAADGHFAERATAERLALHLTLPRAEA